MPYPHGFPDDRVAPWSSRGFNNGIAAWRLLPGLLRNAHAIAVCARGNEFGLDLGSHTYRAGRETIAPQHGLAVSSPWPGLHFLGVYTLAVGLKMHSLSGWVVAGADRSRKWKDVPYRLSYTGVRRVTASSYSLLLYGAEHQVAVDTEEMVELHQVNDSRSAESDIFV